MSGHGQRLQGHIDRLTLVLFPRTGIAQYTDDEGWRAERAWGGRTDTAKHCGLSSEKETRPSGPQRK